MMMTEITRADFPRVVERYVWVAGFLLIRTHYFLTAIMGPAFGWR